MRTDAKQRERHVKHVELPYHIHMQNNVCMMMKHVHQVLHFIIFSCCHKKPIVCTILEEKSFIEHLIHKFTSLKLIQYRIQQNLLIFQVLSI